MIYIILHKTQLAENTGMAIRAMVNTGVRQLRLVSPAHGWPNAKVSLTSAEKDHLVNVEVYDSLETATADLHLIFATSARRRNMIQEIYSPAIMTKKISENTGRNIGIVFGNEKFGLTNDEISMCNFMVEIPSVNFSSYNLAQSVLLICYHIMSLKDLEYKELHTGKTSVATQTHVEYFLKNLEMELMKRNHFSSEEKQSLMMRTVRHLFKRSVLTSQEIQSMIGVVNTLTKY